MFNENIERCKKLLDINNNYKTEVESVQLGNIYIVDMDKCPVDKCCGHSCNLLYMFPGPFV